MGCHEEYSDTQVLQMIGRAGRPQFDTSATAVIMTRTQTKVGCLTLNSLPNNNILNWFKFKAQPRNKCGMIDENCIIKCRLKSIERKGGHPSYQHFLLFQKLFPKGCFIGVIV